LGYYRRRIADDRNRIINVWQTHQHVDANAVWIAAIGIDCLVVGPTSKQFGS
jgi:hypothetical protein